jgi:outer membrane protein assembly factor BamD
MRQNFLFLVLFSLSLISFVSCSTSSVQEADPAALFKEAEEDIKSDHYLIAIEKLRAIKNKFPYSPFAVDSQLRIADVYFLQEQFADAAASYEAFRDLHPKHPQAAYAMFRIGKSYYNDTPTLVSRDLISGQKALDSLGEYVRRYPHETDTTEAREIIVKIRTLLAEKQLYIGDFYFKRDFYDSAKPRYKKVIELYPDTATAKKAAEKLEQIEKKANLENSPK